MYRYKYMLLNVHYWPLPMATPLPGPADGRRPHTADIGLNAFLINISGFLVGPHHGPTATGPADALRWLHGTRERLSTQQWDPSLFSPRGAPQGNRQGNIIAL